MIAILIVVNTFLLSNLLMRSWQGARRSAELIEHLRILTASENVQLADDFRLPADKVLPVLSIDRNRSGEQAVAAAMLGENAVRTESDDGMVRYETDNGYLVWNSDGTVQGGCRVESPPENEREVRQAARRLFRAWGVWEDNAVLDVVDCFATLTSPVVGMPVHNRNLTLFFGEDGEVGLTGFWSFGVPYAYARENGVTCAAADALLAFASSQDAESVGKICRMQAGYRLQLDSSRRLQLVPTWKIETDSGEYLVDCAKKTPI